MKQLYKNAVTIIGSRVATTGQARLCHNKYSRRAMLAGVIYIQLLPAKA